MKWEKLIILICFIAVAVAFGCAGTIKMGENENFLKKDAGDNLGIGGNFTGANVFLPQYIFSHTNVNLSIAGSGVWTNITFSQEEAELKQGIEHAMSSYYNFTFNITEDGVYELNYDFDVEDASVSASNINVAGRVIFVNGTEVFGSVFEADITKQGVEVEVSHDFLATLLAGDQIIFQFNADDSDIQVSTHGTFGDHPESATVVIKKVANLAGAS